MIQPPQLSDGQPIEIEAEGAVLAARFYGAEGSPRAHLVLHGATGVPQRYYRGFAQWASAQGIGVLTYDYRDFGASARGPMRASGATMADWGIRDQLAADRKLAELAPDGPLWLLGHSLGGLTLGFRGYDPRFEKITTIGSGFAHVGDHPWSYRPLALAFWYGPGPMATTLAGYLPGRRLLLGADLPAGVYWQWRRWCTRRDFFNGDIGSSLPEPSFDGISADLRLITMSDDVVVPPPAVQRYADAFPAGKAAYRMLRPEEFGLNALQHIEVMSPRAAAAWPAILGLADEATPLG
ncbi:MAG: alpha/beta hydrolase [Pseudodonghicola sp.]